MRTLQPILKSVAGGVIPTLSQKAGTTERMRGRSWMEVRRQVLVRDGFACRACGYVSVRNQVDHIVPLERGGSHGMQNLQTMCKECHEAKTASETRERAAG